GFLVVALVARLLGRRRTLSLNYVVDEDGQALPERDLFTAAEIVGLRPLWGGAAYVHFVEANAWVAERYPSFSWTRREVVRRRAAGAPAWLEWCLDVVGAPALEALARRTLAARFRRRWDGTAGVALSPHRLKLHAIDHGPGLRAAFS